MSYWSEHPEVYDEICCQGISRFLTGESEGLLCETLLEWTMQPELRPAFRKLCSLAHKDIMAAERLHWESE